MTSRHFQKSTTTPHFHSDFSMETQDRKEALCVGINNYGRRLRSLAGCHNDVDLKVVPNLTVRHYKCYPYKDMSSAAFFKELADFQRKSAELSKFVLTFSGHGGRCCHHRNTICFPDGDVPLDRLDAWLATFKCPVIVLRDSCHSGQLPAEATADVHGSTAHAALQSHAPSTPPPVPDYNLLVEEYV